MNDRHDDGQSDADWLASQFGQTGGVPTPKPKPEPKPEDEKPVPDEVAPPTGPPTLVNPFGAPGAPPPPAGAGHAFPPPAAAPPPAPFPPVGPPVVPAPTTPPVYPPTAPVLPAAAPVLPPVPPTASALPPQEPALPAQPVAPEPTAPEPTASEPTAPDASPFPWALAPGGSPDSATPVAPLPPVVPPGAPVAPPVVPPGVPQQAWSDMPAAPQPFAWQSPHEPAPLDPAFDGGPQVAAEPPAQPMPFETARLPEVAPEASDAPPFWDPTATQAMDQPGFGAPTEAMDQNGWGELAATQLILPPAESFGAAAAATELLGAQPSPDNEPTSALDALFGESRFREYEDGADEGENPFNRPKTEPAAHGPKAGGVGTPQKVLLWVAGGLVAILALIALYLLGTRLPDLFGPAPAVTPSSTPSPSPSETVKPVGPVVPGVYAWDELLGGECLDPWESPWVEEFTVVDCAAPHPAQLVHRGTFPETDPPTEFYPGEEALVAQLALLCSSPGVIDLAAAGQYTDVQIQSSYPVTEEQWDAGQHDYFCFVTRSSGQPLTGSVAVPQAAPAP